MNYDLIISKFNITQDELSDKTTTFQISSEKLKAVLTELRDNKDFSFDFLISICALDLLGYEKDCDDFELNYFLYSEINNTKLMIKNKIQRKKAAIDSIVDIFPSAEFEEREIFDLFGIEFKGNKNLERLLLPKDWEGYPLRKDYKMSDKRLEWNK